MALGQVRQHVGAMASNVRSGVHSAARHVDRALKTASKVDRVISNVKPVYDRHLHPALHATGYGNIADAVGRGLSTYESIRRSIK